MRLHNFTELVLLVLFAISAICAPISFTKPDLSDAARLEGRGLDSLSIEIRAQKPPLPTAEELKNKLRVEKSLFYTGRDQDGRVTSKTAHKWGKDNGNYKILEDSWNPDGWPSIKDANGNYNNKWGKLFFDPASQAFAEKSKGTVYVMLPQGIGGEKDDWDTKSVWARVEWPALQKNTAVEKVIRIDHDGKNQVTIKPRAKPDSGSTKPGPSKPEPKPKAPQPKPGPSRPEPKPKAVQPKPGPSKPKP